MPAFMLSGDVEIQRGDLSQILYERTVGETEYLFGNEITALRQTSEHVRVEFLHGHSRSFDLVVGADGLHSRVRSLAFDGESVLLTHHGYLVAGFTLPNFLGLRRTGLTYSVPGLGVSVSSAREPGQARALFCFRGKPPGDKLDLRAKQQLVESACAGAGWEVPRLLEEMRKAPDLFFDAIASVHPKSFSQGRIALVGDAAYGGTLGGQGTPLAMIGAYVLAGELLAARCEHRVAFERYEARMRPYASKAQKGAKHVGGFLAPPSRLGLKTRNFYLRLFATRAFSGLFKRIVNSAAKDFTLPDYTWPIATSRPSHRLAV
jgi:2-polyprenyl-6-methoxyphenol hydroxylase-like FAD-dependent oxidoreductase